MISLKKIDEGLNFIRGKIDNSKNLPIEEQIVLYNFHKELYFLYLKTLKEALNGQERKD